MRVLVTGAGGFVGRHLVPHLGAAGHAVTATARGGGAGMLRLDDASADADWAAALRGQDAVVHVAGLAHRLSEDPATAQAEHDRVNRDWTLRLARIARQEGVARFLFLSTIGVHPNPLPVPVTEATAIAPATPYARAKAAAEDGLRDIVGDASLVILRPPLVYGPGAPGNLARLVRIADTALPLPFGAIRNRRTLLSVAALCRAIAAVLARWQAGPASGAYVLGDAAPVSTAEIVAALREGLGRPARLLPVPPALLARGLALAGRQAMAAQLLGDLEVDATAFARDFAWTPERDTLAGLRALGAAAHPG